MAPAQYVLLFALHVLPNSAVELVDAGENVRGNVDSYALGADFVDQHHGGQDVQLDGADSNALLCALPDNGGEFNRSLTLLEPELYSHLASMPLIGCAALESAVDDQDGSADQSADSGANAGSDSYLDRLFHGFSPFWLIVIFTATGTAIGGLLGFAIGLLVEAILARLGTWS